MSVCGSCGGSFMFSYSKLQQQQRRAGHQVSNHGVCAKVQITPIKCFSCIQVKLGQCLSEWGSSWSLPRYYWREATLARRFSVGIFNLEFSFRSWLVPDSVSFSYSGSADSVMLKYATIIDSVSVYYYLYVPTEISWPKSNIITRKATTRCSCKLVESNNIPIILWFLSLCAPERGQPKHPIQLGGYIFRLVEE